MACDGSIDEACIPAFKFQTSIVTDSVVNTLICVVGADLTTDDRSYLIHLVNGMAVTDSSCFFYPRLLPLVSRNISADCPCYKDIKRPHVIDVGVF